MGHTNNVGSLRQFVVASLLSVALIVVPLLLWSNGIMPQLMAGFTIGSSVKYVGDMVTLGLVSDEIGDGASISGWKEAAVGAFGITLLVLAGGGIISWIVTQNTVLLGVSLAVIASSIIGIVLGRVFGSDSSETTVDESDAESEWDYEIDDL